MDLINPFIRRDYLFLTEAVKFAVYIFTDKFRFEANLFSLTVVVRCILVPVCEPNCLNFFDSVTSVYTNFVVIRISLADSNG